jgi:hypothetical protein
VLPDLGLGYAVDAGREARHEWGMASWRILVAVLGTAGAAVAASGGTTWENSAAVGVTVNGHAFHDARVESHDCTLAFRILFDAPEKGYSDPRNKVRNYHLFRARVKFSKGQTVESKTFGNGGPGERVYAFEEDTSGAACWGKEPNKIVKLDVIGCRGRGCDLGAFEP